MVFNSLHFLLFFLVFFISYWAVPDRWRNGVLLLGSYYFYGSWDWRFLSLILISTFVDYYCSHALQRQNDPIKRKQLLFVSIASNLSILGFFKYFNFFADSTQVLFENLGWHADLLTLDILLPVGISFYTFQTMSYTIDVYRREMKPAKNLLNFAVFVAFFPQLVAGPIERAKRLLPQVETSRSINKDDIKEGIWLILWGLYKKVVIADNLGAYVDAIYQSPTPVTGGEVLLATYAFAFQIYGDFSGYSDMARGLAKLLGFNLILNFRFPYFVTNPSEFWRNWHISLSTWLRDYLYVPLGGNRAGTIRTYQNLFITMLLGGLWHGAAWTFIIWGAYQGSILILHRLIAPFVQLSQQSSIVKKRVIRILTVAFMFHVTCYGWLIFRADSLPQLGDMTLKLVTDLHFSDNEFRIFGDIVFYTWFLIAMQFIKYKWNDMLVVFRYVTPVRWSVYSFVLYSILMFGNFGSKDFIYFQF